MKIKRQEIIQKDVSKRKGFLLLSFLFAFILTLGLNIILLNTKSESVINHGGVVSVQEVTEQEEENEDTYKGGYFFLTNGASHTINGGKYRGGTNVYGGAFYVGAGCTLTMNNGEISGCIAAYGGAIYIADGGTVILNGGKITGNKAQYGPAIYVEDGGVLENHGCQIQDNEVAEYDKGATINYYVDGQLRATALSLKGKFSMKYAPLKYTDCNGYFLDAEMTEPVEVGEQLNVTQAQTVMPQIDVTGSVNVYTKTATSSDKLIFTSNANGYTVKQNSSNKPSGVVVIPRQYNDGTNGLKNVTAIYSASTASAGAFYNNNNITEVYMPNTISIIGNHAFRKSETNATLTTVVLPSSLVSIGQYAFYNCSGLENVTIGERVTGIGNYAFYGCTGLRTLKYNANINTSFTSVSKIFWFAGGTSDGTGINLTIGKNVTIIPAYLFCDNAEDSNSSSYYPNVTHLYGVLFNNITFEEGSKLKTIGNYAFYGARIEELNLPEGLTSVGEYAFYRRYISDQGFEKISIPSTLQYIGSKAFYTQESPNIYLGGDVADYCNITFGEEWVDYWDLYLNDAEVKHVIITDDVQTIPEYAFLNCRLTSVTIGNGVTSIGQESFANCEYLTSINYNAINVTSTNRNIFYRAGKRDDGITLAIGNNVRIIPSYIFYGEGPYEYSSNNAANITSVQIGNSVTSIGDCAFKFCSFTNVTIPESVTYIGDEAFRGVCLDTIYYNATNCASKSSTERVFLGVNNVNLMIGNNVTKIPAYMFVGLGINVLTFTDTSSVTNIEAGAFCATSLTSVTIPTSVRNIGWKAFAENVETLTGVYYFGGIDGWCSITFQSLWIDKLILYLDGAESPLTNLTIPGTVSIIPSHAFHLCVDLTSVIIEDGVTRIGEDVFYGSGLEEISIPGSVAKIDNRAFNGCFSLTDLYYTSGISDWCDIEFGADWNNNSVKFYINGVEATNLNIPVTVTSMPAYAFLGINNIDNIHYEGNISDWCQMEFGTNWFKVNGSWNLYINNTKLTTLTIPDTIVEIPAYAFGGCALSKIEIPESVKIIGAYAFYYRNSSVNVYYKTNNVNSITKWCGITFGANWHRSGLFYVNNNKVENLTIYASAIPDYAFEGFSSIKSVDILGRVTSIGNRAFEDCSSLTSVTIPDSVTSIGQFAFNSCSYLTEITIDSETIAGWNEDYNNSHLLENYRTQTLYIKDSIISVGTYITDSFTLQATSDKEGYNKYVKNS